MEVGQSHNHTRVYGPIFKVGAFGEAKITSKSGLWVKSRILHKKGTSGDKIKIIIFLQEKQAKVV